MINYTQLVVKTDEITIEWLESRDYANPHDLPNGYRFPIFSVELIRKEIFGTNPTRMAASCSCGNRPIVLDFAQLKEKLLKIGE